MCWSVSQCCSVLQRTTVCQTLAPALLFDVFIWLLLQERFHSRFFCLHKDLYLSTEEPCLSARQKKIPTSVKDPCIFAKKHYVSQEEPCIPTKEPGIFKKSPVSPQKSPKGKVWLQNSIVVVLQNSSRQIWTSTEYVEISHPVFHDTRASLVYDISF